MGKRWWPVLKWYERLVLRSADVVFCISEDDQKIMIAKLGLNVTKCILVPYGITQNRIPTDKILSKQQVAFTHQLDPNSLLLFFNGLLSYQPNIDALHTILDYINPILLKTTLKYRILISGKNLPDFFDNLKKWNNEGINYIGFVEDIDHYTKAADILLNPVNSGGGVKTKMIEAIGLNTNVVATETGATGIDLSVCGDKLKIVPDLSWEHFAEAILSFSKNPRVDTPSAFYSTYNWKEIIKRTIPLI
jgi:glycosyltransferase involved in cell wall biosynthesis